LNQHGGKGKAKRKKIDEGLKGGSKFPLKRREKRPLSWNVPARIVGKRGRGPTPLCPAEGKKRGGDKIPPRGGEKQTKTQPSRKGREDDLRERKEEVPPWKKRLLGSKKDKNA